MSETGSISSKLSDLSTSLGITPKEPDALDEIAEYCPKLSFQQRVGGFCLSFCVGYLITFGSFSLFVELMEGDPIPFVLTYTFGNVCSLLSSTFLCGPKSQFKKMFHDTRKVTTITYLITLFLSFLFCLIPLNHTARLIILIILVLIQFCSLVWYCLSYIPYARNGMKKFVKNSVGIELT